MKTARRRDLKYRFSLPQKSLILIPIFGLLAIFVLPLDTYQFRVINIILHTGNLGVLAIMIFERNYVTWNNNRVKISIQGNKTRRIKFETIDEITFKEEKLTFFLNTNKMIVFRLDYLSDTDRRVLKGAINEAVETHSNEELPTYNLGTTLFGS
ncbi:hypothetical protein EI427_22175 [Flammeovirga pectinis]|uniref:Uncharacterized protein n=1 Tax=Flammeovirga pectinis TaxID=2494373 RepID=A0A3S9P9Q6_9BACT|nr:hypothetical protein [Flammeovirga pectinis]AZQ64936.1 hypothetical protein EI427_22175 [Flammeovirga pectinis]